MATSETTELLSGLNADVLNALARKVGAPTASMRKLDVIDALERLLLSNPRQIVDLLSDVEKKLVAEMAYSDGPLDAHQFEAKHGVQWPALGPRGYPSTDSSPLLIFVGTGYGRVSPAVAQALRGVLEPPPAAAIAVTDALPAEYLLPGNWRKGESRPLQVYEGEAVVFPELRSVLKLVQAGKLKVTEKSNRPTDQAVRRINEVLVVPDFSLEPPAEEAGQWTQHAGPVRAHAWGALVQQCGWAKAKAGKLVLTDEGQKLLGTADPAAFAKGVGEFIGDDELDEFNRINHIHGQSGKGQRFMTFPVERREAIVESMEGWPVNQWIAFDQAARHVWASGNGFDVTEATDSLYLGDAHYGRLYGGSLEISRLYLRAFLMESMATLGLVDIAYTYPHDLWPEQHQSWNSGDGLDFIGRYDGLLYARLNPLGAYCLELTDAYQPRATQAARPFRVLANREVALLDGGQPSAADRHLLELFATPKSEFVWVLDTARILTHVESGGALDEVTRFLESNSSVPIPETVAAMLADLARRSAAVVGAEEALLIEFQDETAAALAAHDTQTARYCHLAGKKHVAVPKKNLRAFRSAIKKLGFVIPDRLTQ